MGIWGEEGESGGEDGCEGDGRVIWAVGQSNSSQLRPVKLSSIDSHCDGISCDIILFSFVTIAPRSISVRT
jgi:hypothetical protein